MSNYRKQLNNYLTKLEFSAGNVLTIGIEKDERKIIKKVSFDNWTTLDINPEFKPDIIFNINQPIIDEDGDLKLNEEYFNSFDTCFAFNIWEYVYDPVTAHKNINLFLKNDGIFITNYPFIYCQHAPQGIDYLRYAPDGIKKFLCLAGFNSIIDWIEIDGNPLLEDFYNLDGMHKLNKANHFLIGLIVKVKK